MTKDGAPNKGRSSEPLAATAPRDIAKFEAWLATNKGPIVTAAYNEAKRRTRNAWKPSEFQTALHYAVVLKTIEPLAKFLESETLLTRNDRHALARFVRSFEAPKAGRPPGPLPGDVNAAQRNAVYLVRLWQQAWLNKNNRQRVPTSTTNAFIADAINVASKALDVSPKKLSPDDIRALVNKTSRKILD